MIDPITAAPIPCGHCEGESRWNRRGLCHKCHSDPAVRALYPRGKTGPRAAADRPARPDGKRWKAMRPGGAKAVLAALGTPAAARMVVVCNIDPARGVRLVGYDGGLAQTGGGVLFELQFAATDADRAYVESLILGAVKRAARAKARRLTDGGDVKE